VKRLWIRGDCIVEADKKVLDKLTQMSRKGTKMRSLMITLGIRCK
jgi:hypothetical protein